MTILNNQNLDLKSNDFDVLDEEKLRHVVQYTCLCAWEKEIEEQDINRWLTNFNGEYLGNKAIEQKIALWLVSHFTYYTENNLRDLCIDAYNKYIHYIICESKDAENDDLESILKSTFFLPLGEQGESGSYMAYIFRQSNNIGTEMFMSSRIDLCNNIVLLDDASFSGKQLKKYVTRFYKKYKIENKKVYILLLFCTEESREKMKKIFPEIDIISSCSLDSRDKIFSDDSYAFSDELFKGLKNSIKGFCEYYGQKLSKNKKDILGHNNGQYMVGFGHNTPNNTLPIFWGKESGWIPLFERFPKRTDLRCSIDERRYY